MKLFVREEASADLEAIFDWISRDNPHAAARVVSRIRRRFDTLLTPGLAHMGRPGRDPGTRELIEGSYIIVYEVSPGDGGDRYSRCAAWGARP